MSDEVKFILVGNKVDLIEYAEVDNKEARAYADEIDAYFIKTSAKENIQVSELFGAIGNKIEIPLAHRKS